MGDSIRWIEGKERIIVGIAGIIALVCVCCPAFILAIPSGEEPVATDEVDDLHLALDNNQQTATPLKTFTLRDNEPGTLKPSNTPRDTVTPRPTNTASPRPTDTSTSTPTPTSTHTFTPSPTYTPRPTNTPDPTSTSLPPTYTPTQEQPANEVGSVVNVIDGDTIEVNMGGSVYSIRLIGIDSPEQGQPFFTEAFQAINQLVSGQTVTLVKDVSDTDQYDRLLRYVYTANGTFVNAEMVRLGFAAATAYPPDTAHSGTFAALEQEAKIQGNGMWSQPAPTATIPPAPTTTILTPAPPQNCDPAYPDVCIPPPPPDLDCPEISHRRFRVLPPDPHRFDGDNDGIGCESG